MGWVGLRIAKKLYKSINPLLSRNKMGWGGRKEELDKIVRDIIFHEKKIRINSKELSYALWNRLIFGNKLRTWDDYDALLRSGYNGKVSMRVKLSSGGGCAAYEIPVKKVPWVMKEWVKQGIPRTAITFNESAPDDKLLLQGCVRRSIKYYDLDYSTEKKPMREAMKNALVARGAEARVLLEENLDPNSYNDLLLLMDLFPEHVIEFSTYSINVGCLPHRNTVIWEVRDY